MQANGQSDEKISRAVYKTQKAEMERQIDFLSKKEKDLRNEIDSLNNFSIVLDGVIRECLLELYIVKYGEENGVLVSQGRVWKGMSEEMLRDSWGEPDKIKKNVEDWGTFTQWYYGDITYFFRDGEMIDWEEGEWGDENN